MADRVCYSDELKPHLTRRSVCVVVLGCLELVLVLGLGIASADLAAAESPSLEDKVKAALTYKFLRYVAWPGKRHPAPDSPIVFGVAGDRAVHDLLMRSVASAKMRGRTVRVRWFASPEGLEECHVVFLGREFPETSAKLLEHLARESVLAVGDSDRFCEQGGTIQLFRDGGKMRFMIRRSVARRARLKVSSKLLRLGSIFEEPE